MRIKHGRGGGGEDGQVVKQRNMTSRREEFVPSSKRDPILLRSNENYTVCVCIHSFEATERIILSFLFFFFHQSCFIAIER